MNCPDVVVLIPGFLGFERIGHFPYFANRVGAALRGCLVGLCEVDVPVLPVKTRPTESLAARQRALLATLQGIGAALGPVERIHLVGHSTGGVDAYLLTGAHPLDPEASWRQLDPERVRHKIKTVISIASPHLGTCLALSPPARFIRHPLGSIDKSPSLARTLLRLPFSLHVDEMALGALLGAVTDAGGAAAYLLDALWSRTLVDDLQPRRLVRIHDRFERELDVLVRSVVTAAGLRTRNYGAARGRAGVREPDLFFKEMYAYAAGSGFDEVADNPHRIEKTLALLAGEIAGPKLIQNSDTELREISPLLNDGLVNTGRQLVNPADPDELLAIVIGDHIDVMGYYPRWTPAWEEEDGLAQVQLRSGILHSGSGFGDEQFFGMCHRVAGAIAGQIEEAARRKNRPRAARPVAA